MTRTVRPDAGLTLVELMVALVVSSLVIGAALSVGLTMMRSFRDHGTMVSVQRAARVSMDFLADAVRNSNPGVLTGMFEDLIGCSGQVPGISVTNRTNAPDEISLVYASGGIFTSSRSTYSPTSTGLTVLDAEEVAGQDFFPGDYIVITNLDVGTIVRVADVQASGSEWQLGTIQPSSCGAVSFPGPGFEPGSLVIRGRFARFFVQNDAGTGNIPMLMMDPDGPGPATAEPVADGIEDLQIAVAVDANGDGTITEVGIAPNDDEWYYNIAGDMDPPGGIPPRAVRLTLIARSVSETSNVASFTRPAAEDRAASTVPDPYRRRVLTTTVELRNLEGSP
ncbi:MAG: prepilin-type N-terminal cleavage/methylation domain-containing protein [Deltaproteobacteria bacterium]|nr:MAG: prepilin-type N-terminal cleavage/methylation domain-containing protein [Deltaproteobacteria bacterium]